MIEFLKKCTERNLLKPLKSIKMQQRRNLTFANQYHNSGLFLILPEIMINVYLSHDKTRLADFLPIQQMYSKPVKCIVSKIKHLKSVNPKLNRTKSDIKMNEVNWDALI